MAILVGVTMGHLEGRSCGAVSPTTAYLNVHVVGIPIRSTANGCAYQGLLKLSSFFWIPGLVFEPILFLLVAYKAWSPFKNDTAIPLVTKIARDRFDNSYVTPKSRMLTRIRLLVCSILQRKHRYT